MTMATQHATRRTPSQNGKKPLFGPSVPQPIPRRTESQMTRAPPAISSSAVVRSAARTTALRSPLLLEEAPLVHELLVKLLVLLDPLHVLGAGGEGRLERAVFHVPLPVR